MKIEKNENPLVGTSLFFKKEEGLIIFTKLFKEISLLLLELLMKN